MKKFDIYLLCLLVTALFIWSKDFTLTGSYVNTLPILISFPLFYFLGIPWAFQRSNTKVSKAILIIAIFSAFLGIIFQLTLFYAIAWSSFFWIWLQLRLSSEVLEELKPGFQLLVLGFPWLIFDGQAIGWWFRLTGSWVIENVFSSAGFDVYREGTFLLINEQSFSVDSACSGINSLQSLLIAGTFLGATILKQQFRCIWAIPFLFIMAWIANTIRILVITLAALFIGPEFAMGAFHEIGGLVVLGLMFVLCWFCFCFIKENSEKPNAYISLPKTIFG